MNRSKYAINNIGPGDFDDILSQYSSVVPEKLAELEEQRLIHLPAEVTKRKKDGQAYLTRSEVAVLVDWKLSHGTFRPSLKALVQQNSEEFVLEITKAGLAESAIESTLTTLTKLKGIGPATASLLLSTSDPKNTPFFSDELFRWAFWEDEPGCRWDRKIKYSAKEYRELVAKITGFMDHFGKEVSAIDVEKVAYVLGKQKTDLSSSSDRKPSKVEERPDRKRLAEDDTKPTEVSITAAKKRKPSPQSPKAASKLPTTNTDLPKRTTRSSAKSIGA